MQLFSITARMGSMILICMMQMVLSLPKFIVVIMAIQNLMIMVNAVNMLQIGYG